MVLVAVNVPTQEELRQMNRFAVYLNYLRSISSHLLGSGYEDLSRFRNITNTSTFNSIRGRKDADLDSIAKFLRNAWFTELQISITADIPGFTGVVNHWAAVQVYYVIYCSLRALFGVMEQNVSREHSKNLKAIAELIKNRSSLFPDPWCIACIGNPESSPQYLNVPVGVEMNPKISPLTSSGSVSFYNSFALFLKTTRAKQIEQLCDKWKQDKKTKRISPLAKKAIIESLPPTTIFNCMFRLRVRSNYEDADSFLLSIENATEAFAFNKALRVIAWQNLFLLELLIARHISKNKFDQIVHSFVKVERRYNHSKELIQRRWEEMKCFW